MFEILEHLWHMISTIYLVCHICALISVGGDPFGVKVKNCYISNNILFNDYPTTGNTGDMTVQVMENG